MPRSRPKPVAIALDLLSIPLVRHTIGVVVAATAAWAMGRLGLLTPPSASLPLAPVPGPVVIEAPVVEPVPIEEADHEADVPPEVEGGAVP